MASALQLVVLLPFAAAGLVPVAARRFHRYLGWLLLPLPAAITVYLLRLLPRLAGGETFASVWRRAPALDLVFCRRQVEFGHLFELFSAGIGAQVVAYSDSYLGPGEDLSRFYVCLLLFMGAMLGVVTADNLLTLYMFWEITSVSSFLLIG